jgi:hypothetical protein
LSGDPQSALSVLSDSLRSDGSLIAGHAIAPSGTPDLGMLAAGGPRAAAAPSEYALLVETIREGYLLHYDAPRLFSPMDGDLALLAGDYLYARGLERLAALGDIPAVAELSDLISLCGQLHAESEAAAKVAGPLWLSSVVAVAAGPSSDHDSAKRAARDGRPHAASELWESARLRALDAGISDRLGRAAEAVGFAPQEPDLG